MQIYTHDLIENANNKDYKLLLFRYLSFWPLFLGLIILCLAVAWLYLRYAIPVYESTATLLIKDDNKGADDPQASGPIDFYSSKKIVENEIEVLRSRTVMQEVVKKLGLYAPLYQKGRLNTVSAYGQSPVKIEIKNPDSLAEHREKIYFDYDEFKRQVIISKQVYPLNVWVNSDYGELRFLPSNNYKPSGEKKTLFFYLVDVKKVAADLLNRLNVSPASKVATIVNLKLRDQVPKRGEDILNELIIVYNQAAIEDKNILASNALTFVKERLRFVEGELDSVEGVIQQYKASRGIVNISEQGKMFLESVESNDQKISELNVQLAILNQVEKYVLSKNETFISQESDFNSSREESLLNSVKQQLREVNNQLSNLPALPTVNKYRNMNIITLIDENRRLARKRNDPAAKAKIEDNKNKIVELEQQVTSASVSQDNLRKREELVRKKDNLEATIAGLSRKTNSYRPDINKPGTNADAGSAMVPSTSGLNDRTLSQLLEKLSNAEIQYEKIRKSTAENNPLSVSLRNQIQRIKPSILENIRNQRDNLEAGRTSLAGTSGRYSSMLSAIPEKERQLLDITRQQSIKNNIYTFLLQKREEAALSFASAVAASRLVDSAAAGFNPVSPRRGLTYAIALTLGLAMGVGFVFIKDLFYQSVRSRTEIEELTSFPIIGQISYNPSKPIVISYGERTFIAEQFRQLRTSLSYLHIGGDKKKVLVTSSIPGEGKSFVASNLAISLALTEKKVALIELDLRKPKLSQIFQESNNPGLSEYLMGKVSMNQIIKKTEINNNLYLIPAGSIPANPSELILHDRLSELLNHLEKDFDYVIIETAPVGAVTDAYVVSKLCDATLYVVRYGLTQKEDIKMMEDSLKIRELKNTAIVFNAVRLNRLGKYGYGYTTKVLKEQDT